MKNKMLGALTSIALLTSSFAISTFTNAENALVVSGSKLDIEQFEKKFDHATLTITGPNGYEYQDKLDSSEAQIELERLGELADGNYNYQIQYTNNGGVEVINDPKTGRHGAERNLGKTVTKSGFFNVKDSEFVMQTAESESAATLPTELNTH